MARHQIHLDSLRRCTFLRIGLDAHLHCEIARLVPKYVYRRFALACSISHWHPVSDLAVVATELGILAFWANQRGKNIVSGLLLALTVGLKPQVGLCFVLYFLARRKWQPAIVSVAGIMAIASVAIGRLNMAHVHWLANYELDNRALFTSGVLGDFTGRNPLRFGLVNLQVALYPFLHGRETTNTAALLLGMAFSLGACS